MHAAVQARAGAGGAPQLGGSCWFNFSKLRVTSRTLTMHNFRPRNHDRSRSSANRKNVVWTKVWFWIPAILFGTLIFTSSFGLEIAKLGSQAPEHAETGEEGQSTLAMQTVLMLAYGLLGGGLLVRHNERKNYCTYWPVVLLVACLVAYILASVSWSDDPKRTVRKGVLVACVLLGGMGIGKTWSHIEFCHAIIGCSTTFLLIGVFDEIYFGNFLRGGGDYRFSGVFHPNIQAFSCALMILACSSMYHVSGRKYYLLLAVFVGCFLILTKGRTVTAGVCVASVWLWWKYFSFRTLVILAPLAGLGLSLVLLGFSFSSEPQDVIGSVGRMGREDETANPTTLTGRLPIWQEALSDFTKRPILGYGYGAYWMPRRMEYYERLTGWSFNHSHSVYIESLLDLGFLGAVIGLLLVIVTVYRALGMRNSAAANGGRFVVTIAIFAVVTGFSETAFVGQGYPALVGAICIGYIAFQGTDYRTRYSLQRKY